MSLSNWKRLAQKRTETGRMKNQLYDEITEAKIKSKTSDARITKSFRLDEIIEGLRAQKPKNRPQGPQKRIRPAAPAAPDAPAEEQIDYAPEVDPYEDMDVEGLLNLQDYVAPQQEKQIAGPPPKYEMDPSFWNLEEGDESLPPEYSFVEEKGEGPLAIEPPPDDDDDLDRGDINRILDSANLPNYDDIEMRLSQPEMTPLKRSIYLERNIKKANCEISRITSSFKSNTSKRLNQAIKNNAPRDVIEKLEREKDMAHKFADTRLKPIQEYRDYLKVQKKKSTKGSGLRTGRGARTGRGVRGSGVYFYNDAKELLKKLTLIIGEMEAGNTSVKMRNMGQTILDTLLRAKDINKSQYQKLVKKYFRV